MFYSRKILIVLCLCLVIVFCFIGCKKHLNKLCTDWMKDAKTVDNVIIKVREIHSDDPNEVSKNDIKALESLRDRIIQDAGYACTLDELIPLK